MTGRRPFGIQTRARGAGQVRPDTNMDGGPFKLPTKENADAARKKKVRRVPSASSNDPQTLFLIDSQQPSHLGTPPPSPRRKRSPRSRSGWSRTSRRNTSRIARASSTSPRCAPRSHRSPAQLCAPHRRLKIDPPPRTRPRTNAPPFAIEPHTRHPLTHTLTPPTSHHPASTHRSYAATPSAPR